MKAAWILALLFATTTALAESGADEAGAREQARVAFAHALALSDDHRLQEALLEFQHAYQLSPHFAVFYNLGKTYAALSMPVEAVGALERYLSEGGARIDAARRAQVDALLSAERAQIATLVLEIEPIGADVSIDGSEIGTAPLTEPIRLVAGPHQVQVAREGYRVFTKAITLIAQERTTWSVRLDSDAGAGAEAERGLLALHCPLPDVELRLDGAMLGMTPLAVPLALTPGHHTLELSREGYRRQSLSVSIDSASVSTAECALIPTTPLPQAGRIDVAVSEHNATIRIDGAASSKQPKLPVGRHVIEVTRPGFHPYERVVTLRNQQRLSVDARLVPDDAYRQDYEARARAERTWGLATGAGGVVLTGAAVALLVWNQGRNDDWATEDRALSAAVENGSGDPVELRQRQSDNNSLTTAISRWDTIGFATGVVGVLLSAAGATLWLTADDPGRYRGLALHIAPHAVSMGATGQL